MNLSLIWISLLIIEIDSLPDNRRLYDLLEIHFSASEEEVRAGFERKY